MDWGQNSTLQHFLIHTTDICILISNVCKYLCICMYWYVDFPTNIIIAILLSQLSIYFLVLIFPKYIYSSTFKIESNSNFMRLYFINWDKILSQYLKVPLIFKIQNYLWPFLIQCPIRYQRRSCGRLCSVLSVYTLYIYVCVLCILYWCKEYFCLKS